nr:MAG TPA: hypothetical protein [Caudoviricetes sp.]
MTSDIVLWLILLSYLRKILIIRLQLFLDTLLRNNLVRNISKD